MLFRSNKKEKSIAFQVEKHESSDEGNVSDDESVVLLIQSFNRYLKRMNKKKISQGSKKMNQVQRNKKTTNPVEIRNQGKEFNAENVKVSAIYNQNVQTP